MGILSFYSALNVVFSYCKRDNEMICLVFLFCFVFVKFSAVLLCSKLDEFRFCQLILFVVDPIAINSRTDLAVCSFVQVFLLFVF